MKVNGFQGFRFPLSRNSKAHEPERDFGSFLRSKIKEVDRAQKEALERLQDFSTGKDPDLVELTLSLTQAELSFKFLMKIRNKVIEAYQEIMRMQI